MFKGAAIFTGGLAVGTVEGLIVGGIIGFAVGYIFAEEVIRRDFTITVDPDAIESTAVEQ